MDVAAVFFRLCELPLIRQRLSRLAGRPIDTAVVEQLAVLVYLHDLGKLCPGFQSKARPEIRVAPTVNHSVAGYCLIQAATNDPRHLLHPVIRMIAPWGEGVGELLVAILAHHGRPVGSPTARDQLFSSRGYDAGAAVAAYLALLRQAFPDPGNAALPDAPGFVHMIAGLTALADWIGSDRRFFEFDAAPDAGYPDHARHMAQTALRSIGLDPDMAPASTAFDSITGGAFRPRAAQRLVGEADPLASQLQLLEAETGSGKTEAALWRFALLHAAGLVSGLYFAVPTRSAARQLHRRVDAAMKRLFGAEAPEAVLAIPGQLLAGEATGQRLSGFETRWDDTESPQPARWAAEHATRFLAATVAVGTVDQAMLAGLKVKHAHLRGAALSRSLLVIDEVHASDAFMSRIVAEVLSGHLAAGGQAMLMSATLGSSARCQFLNTPPPGLDEAIAAPYPAMWSLGQTAPAAAEADGRRKVVAMARLATMDPEETARRAIATARQGARVLVVRNTVSMACETFAAVIAAGGDGLLMQAGGGPALHHSRFAAEDRARLDAAVEWVLGPRHDRRMGGAIVIGSQTLEQSLDVCADYLISDLCPVDVLLQRLGRLHRHDLPRPAGFEAPRCLVLCPEDGLDPLTKPAFVNGLGAWSPRDGTTQGIYLDLACLSLTEALIAERPVWDIPSMNRELVERATHPDARAAEIARRGQAWAGYETRIIGREVSQRGQAGMWLLRREERFPTEVWPQDEHVQTRLGEQGPLVTFAPCTLGPFGQEITQIAVPAHWGVTAPEGAVPCQVTSDGLVLTLGDRQFVYTRAGLARNRDRVEKSCNSSDSIL